MPGPNRRRSGLTNGTGELKAAALGDLTVMVDNHGEEPATRFSAATIAERLRDILYMLDHSDVTPDIGAHVDLALCRLEDQMASNENSAAHGEYSERPGFN